MPKMKLVMLFTLLVSFCVPFAHPVNAEEQHTLIVEELDSNQLLGTYSGRGTITVSVNGESLGELELSEQGPFTIKFNRYIAAQSILTVQIKDQDGYIESHSITYHPASITSIDIQQNLLTGWVEGKDANIYAYVGDQSLPMKDFRPENGSFVFYLPSRIQPTELIKVVSETDGVKNGIFFGTEDASIPAIPKINGIYNNADRITGTAEPYSQVMFFINGKWYSTLLEDNTEFSFELSEKLPAGTKISTYTINRLGKESPRITITVLDKIPPKIPVVSDITSQSFFIKGNSEVNSKIYILKNGKSYKSVQANSSGNFTVKIPLQKANTLFEFYAVDKAGNKSAVTKVRVSKKNRPSKKVLSARLVKQMPKLPRGCEVTSLSMLLDHAGVKVSNLTLAKKVKKDPTPYRVKSRKKVYFGNPNNGFVGNMYTFGKPGLGVYHKPIADLANTYLPDRIIDLTGSSFDVVKDYVGAGHPVWVVTTSTFRYVPSSHWQTWYTPTGKIRITYKEHAVLITGYDSKYVYVNDPLYGKKNKKLNMKSFMEGWKQFGNQAVSYY
ncbi:C39 family peptidase [Bacillus sp. FJAT-49736]|uniref:C39 family peptidase n=1 Tax=Bacillus sp. FJAT-49736 TaxID=2833582 RepID=UPI001BC9D9FE|nr:C39 family peptidase [Bacillus sp. FJAT-49736]MBS4174233.1 C39 family peptidase [Bacillus sp. FJAT-49736]